MKPLSREELKNVLGAGGGGGGCVSCFCNSGDPGGSCWYTNSGPDDLCGRVCGAGGWYANIEHGICPVGCVMN